MSEYTRKPTSRAERSRGSGVRSLISRQLLLMKPGDAVTFTRAIRRLPAPYAGNEFSRLLSSYLARRRPGCAFTQESFVALTYAGNAYAGVIVTLVSEPEGTQRLGDTGRRP